MCLSRITKVYKKPTSKVTRAWKVFDGEPSNLAFEYRSLGGKQYVERGKWLTAEQIDDGYGYITGFHAFTSRKDAQNWACYRQNVVAVKVRGITTRGLQRDMVTIVAREMFVPKQRKAKKAGRK